MLGIINLILNYSQQICQPQILSLKMQVLFNCFADNNHHIVLFAVIIIMPTNKVRIHIGSDLLGTPAIKLRQISWVCVKPRSQERRRPVA